ncbi:MAG TPA: bifunctional 4-hydroxy-2-oxoglutarate aldolase/2-dehydro-3-deoxy-phosphogluconate aldolase [Gemmatimonadales bacterium]|nr:bifunctional 4-hydroxy-2-oxoglutarate aldolase/2-dehydro-3-deoxy-phosphogluconate aldolase [Gemmatimonadales bacterium]HYT84332.1 bifunctional 4-hydroxy-2-oxoglutarate aldolase/2-dehydro-3-deoxy-phosphogluconate aldolase [Gemmatimonadales bacterium]
MTDPLLAGGVIAVVRLPEAFDLRPAARALAAGGVGAVEITLTTPGAIAAIAALTADGGVPGRAAGACVVGAGSVLDARAAREAIAAGARFVVSPTLEPAVIALCRDENVPCIPGAFSPTEILQAWRAGASLVKLFPAVAAGPGYLRDLLAPLPFLRVVPSGGVSLESAGDWIRAGAAAVSVGGALVSAARLGTESTADLTARARSFVERVAEARRHLAAAGR